MSHDKYMEIMSIENELIGRIYKKFISKVDTTGYTVSLRNWMVRINKSVIMFSSGLEEPLRSLIQEVTLIIRIKKKEFSNDISISYDITENEFMDNIKSKFLLATDRILKEERGSKTISGVSIDGLVARRKIAEFKKEENMRLLSEAVKDLGFKPKKEANKIKEIVDSNPEASLEDLIRIFIGGINAKG